MHHRPNGEAATKTASSSKIEVEKERSVAKRHLGEKKEETLFEDGTEKARFR